MAAGLAGELLFFTPTLPSPVEGGGVFRSRSGERIPVFHAPSSAGRAHPCPWLAPRAARGRGLVAGEATRSWCVLTGQGRGNLIANRSRTYPLPTRCNPRKSPLHGVEFRIPVFAPPHAPPAYAPFLRTRLRRTGKASEGGSARRRRASGLRPDAPIPSPSFVLRQAQDEEAQDEATPLSRRHPAGRRRVGDRA